MSDKLVIIDGNSIFYRSFYALPLLNNSEGEYSNAVYGFAMQILNIIQNIKPRYMVVAFDASKKTFRNNIFKDYKANRKPMPEELRSQIVPLKKMLSLMNITIVEKDGIEGDDVIGIISKRFLDTETIIVTGDRDSFQLVDETTSVYFTKKGTSDVKIMTPKTLKEEYGVTPKEFIDLKALQGDASDNIPGVSGVGPKTATGLIQKYGSIENLYEHIDELSGKVKEKIENGREMAFLSKELATILTSGDIDLSLKDCDFQFPFSAPVYDFFKHYEFKTLLKNNSNFDLSIGEKKEVEFKIEENCDLKKLQNVKNIIEKQRYFAYFFNKNEIHFSFGETEYIFNISNDLFGYLNENIFFDEVGSIFSDDKILKICFDSKQDMYYLKRFKIELNNYFDSAIAKYVADGVPVDSVHDIFFDDDLTFIASNLYAFYKDYLPKFDDVKLHNLFYNIELPLSKILFSMENFGFKVDTKILDTLKEKYNLELNELEDKIYSIAGEKFNINSPKQLGEVLYSKLGLSHDKKMSTSAENLEEIKNEHEIVEFILRYRKVAKFLGTYIDGIFPHVDKNNFIHTYFKQTLTTTGRLSSVEPNLQNIPIRSEESREIRSMFVASSNNNVLVDADYSQIELRILASMSGDEIFVDAFNNGDDIHTKTASVVFGVPENVVSPEMRRMAKIVNFGIVYGISEFGLAEDLKISTREARVLIQNFYAKHQEVTVFLKKLVDEAKETGKATTLFGRTRKMFDIKASNYNVRTRAERAAQNMPVQGTAADIIKIAMVGTYNALQKGGFKAKLIMQIHDELIIDCPKEEEEQVTKILQEQMENACKLKVPLEVSVSSSFRWSDGH